MAKNKDLYKNRHLSLAEHRAAVKARKEKERLTGGKKPKTGAAAVAAIEKLTRKKPAAKTKPKAKPPAAKPAPKATTKPKAKPASDKAVKGGYTVSPEKRARRQMPSNPKLKSQTPIRGREKIAAEVKAASGGSKQQSRSGKPKNPKKGQTYKTWTGTTMVWTGKNWKQKTK